MLLYFRFFIKDKACKSSNGSIFSGLSDFTVFAIELRYFALNLKKFQNHSYKILKIST